MALAGLLKSRLGMLRSCLFFPRNFLRQLAKTLAALGRQGLHPGGGFDGVDTRVQAFDMGAFDLGCRDGFVQHRFVGTEAGELTPELS